MRKLIGHFFLIVAGGGCLGALLLSACFLLPVNEKIHTASMNTLDQEGWYPVVPVLNASQATYFKSFLPGVLDGHTDKIMVDTALNESAPGNVLYRAMRMHSDYQASDYARYWHGYVAVLRPLMLVLDYEKLRIINGALQMLLVFTAAGIIYRKKGMRYGLAFLTSYFLLMPQALSLSLQFSWVFYIGMTGCLILLKHEERFRRGKAIFYLFLLLGMASSFMDLLTYPLYTWAFPMIWWIVLKDGDEGGGKFAQCRNVLCTGISWAFGYGGMWCMKWLIATCVLGRNVLKEASEKINYYSGIDPTDRASWGQALSENWKHYSYELYLAVLILWLVWFAAASLIRGWKSYSSCAALLLTGCAPLVWYRVLVTHTTIHHFFTYRVFNVSVLAALAIFLGSLRNSQAKSYLRNLKAKDGLHNLKAKNSLPGKKEIFKRLATLGAVCVLSCLAAFLTVFFSKEEQYVMNGDSPSYHSVPLSEEEQRCSFTPAFSLVRQFSLGLHTDSTEGSCEITLRKGDRILDRISIPMDKVKNDDFSAVPVKWNLKAGETYELGFVLKDCEDCSLLVTDSGEMPLTEFGHMAIGQEETEQHLALEQSLTLGQPLAGILYLRRATRHNLLFIAVTCLGIFLTLYPCAISLQGKGKPVPDQPQR